MKRAVLIVLSIIICHLSFSPAKAQNVDAMTGATQQAEKTEKQTDVL